MANAQNDPYRIVVWALPPRYNERLMSTTEAGLEERIRSALRNGRYFAGVDQASIHGVTDTLEGHVRRAMRERRQLRLSEMGAWGLFAKRQLVAPAGHRAFVDEATIAAFDDACSVHILNTFLSRNAFLSDQWPGKAEWWVETNEPTPPDHPVLFGPVAAALRRRIAAYLGLTPGEFAIHILNAEGGSLSQLSGDTPCGSFILQVNTRSAT